jgi:hypothetical protein
MRLEKHGRGRAALAAAGGGVVALALLACASTPGGAAGAPQAFESLFSAAHSGIEQKRHDVVRDQAAWARAWSEIHARSGSAPAPPVVDFGKDMLILVALGTRPSGGFSVKVRGIEASGERVEVEVLESCPPQGAMVTAALTQPVEVVRVAAQPLAPTFKEVREPSCR